MPFQKLSSQIRFKSRCRARSLDLRPDNTDEDSMVGIALALLSILFLATLWRWLATRSIERQWKGEVHRFFERDWEIKTQGNSLSFAIPSFKTAFFEVRSATLIEKIMVKLPWNKGLGIEKEFFFDAEDPRLDKHFEADLRFADSFRKLSEFGKFSIVSSSEELRGIVTLKDSKAKIEIDTEEFKKILESLGKILDAQFTIPLTEMKTSQIRLWHFMKSLPMAMLGTSLFFTFGVGLAEIMLGSPQTQGPSLMGYTAVSMKLGLGVAFFVTSLSVMAVAWGAPAHTFSRIIGKYVLIFSWSVFLWISSAVGVIRVFFEQ